MAVRGVFDLNDRPAGDALRRLRRQGAETDATMERLGRTVDGTFTTKNVEQGRRYERMLRDVDRTARTTLGSVRREWASTERQTIKSVGASEVAVDRLQVRLAKLGATKVSPQIDLDGVTEALAQTELLERRLGALSRRTATPRVGIPTSSFGGGSSRVPTTSSGGGSMFSGGLKIPFAGRAPWPLVGAALAAAPPLVGGAGALAGSFGAAALGAGSIGLGAAGVGSAALGLGLPVGISSVAGIKEASDALKKYREEVLQTGPASQASRQALRLYNMALEQAPGGTRAFLRARTNLSEEFRAETGPARAGFTRIGTRGINVGRQLTPLVGGLSNRFFGEAQGQADQFGDFLAGDRSRAFIRSMGNEATRTLGPGEDIAEQGTETFMNLSRAARPFFREGIEFIDRWTAGWRENSRDIKGVRSDMRGWVDNLKSWGKLIGATGRLGGSLLGAGTGSGRSMVTDLTKQLNEWDRWVDRNPRKVRSFFRESVDSVEKIASGITAIGKSLWEIGQLLGPLLTNATQLVTLMGNAGLLTPGALPLLLSTGAGVRNLSGRIRGGVPGTAGGGIAGGVAAGAAIGAAVPQRGLLSRGRDFAGRLGRVPISGGMVSSWDAYRMGLPHQRFSPRAAAGELGGLARTGGATFLRGAASRYLPIAGALAAIELLGGENLQNIASNQTFGLIPRTADPAQEGDEGSQRAQGVLARIGRRHPDDYDAQVAAIRRRRRKLLQESPSTHFAGFEVSSGNEVSAAERREARVLREADKGLSREHRSGVSRGALGEIQSVADLRIRRGQNPLEAFKSAADSIEKRAGQLKGRTSREFSEMSLDWAKRMARANPRLRSVYKEMAENLEGTLRRMGKNVAVIGGNIVDVSRKALSGIPDVISSVWQRALSRQTEGLTALEKQAMIGLTRMGYSRGEARRLTLLAQTGGSAGKQLYQSANRNGPMPDNMAGPQISDIRPGQFKGSNAGGGRLPMLANGSMHDDIYLGNNQWGAAGELMVNRHTERRVDRLLRLTGTSLGREVGREQRPHSKPIREENAFLGGRRTFATGGIMSAGRLASRMGLSVGEGPGYGGVPSSGHTGGSLHYSGLAYDVSGSADLMRRYFLTASRLFRGSINELFYDPMGYYYDEGQRVPGSIGGHSDHVHIGFFPSGAQMRRGAGRGALGGGVPRINLRGQRSGLGGIPGAAADRANQMVAAGMSDRLNRLVGGAGAGGRASTAGGLNAWLSRALRITGHYSPENLQLLRGRAMQESGGDPRAVNNWDSNAAAGHPSQGLLQTIPETFATYKEPGLRGGILNPVANAAAAINYMFARYGHIVGPSSTGYATGGRSKRGFAGWFRDGGRGRVNGPTLIGLGEAGPEDFEVTPAPKRRRGGRGGGGGRKIEVNVSMGGVTIRGSGDAKRHGKEIGDTVAARIVKALEDSDGVDEEELVG